MDGGACGSMVGRVGGGVCVAPRCVWDLCLVSCAPRLGRFRRSKGVLEAAKAIGNTSCQKTKQSEREAQFCQSELTVQLISEPLVLVLVLAVFLVFRGGASDIFILGPKRSSVSQRGAGRQPK